MAAEAIVLWLRGAGVLAGYLIRLAADLHGAGFF